MHIVAAVDWSDQAFAGVKAVPHLYGSTGVTLVHAVDLGLFEYPALAPAMAKEAYAEVRKSMVDSGLLLVNQASGLLPPDLAGKANKVCETGNPSEVIVKTAQSEDADLLGLGLRGLGRVAELVLGSVSHQVLSHAPCPVLLVKRAIEQPLRRVLMAIEGPDDAERLQRWLLAHPFKAPVDLSVIVVVPTQHVGDPSIVLTLERWREIAATAAKQLVDRTAAKLNGPHFRATGQVLTGEPSEVISQEATRSDLLVVGSHGRKGLDRVLLGSVSHAVAHRAACPVLVIGHLGPRLEEQRAAA